MRKGILGVVGSFLFLSVIHSASAASWQFFDGGGMSSQAVLIAKAQKALGDVLHKNSKFQALSVDEVPQFVPTQIASDTKSNSVRFAQIVSGYEVFGREAIVHIGSSGNVHDVKVDVFKTPADIGTKLRLSEPDLRKIVSDFYKTEIEWDGAPKLMLLPRGAVNHLVYHVLTKTTAKAEGMEAFVDAQSGQVWIEFPRSYDADGGSFTVFDANTEAAHAEDNIDEKSGAPKKFNFGWYTKVWEDGKAFAEGDFSAHAALRNAQAVYAYYRGVFNRLSFDNQDTRLTSVVHIGRAWNNAFWSTEAKVMGYGDGDGEHLIDLTRSIDVAAHEMTHGVTATTANLVYMGESGALNESYSDFFGRMVDYHQGDWLIGKEIISPKLERRALRNMMEPEEFNQPGTNSSELKGSTEGPCDKKNDRCWVHKNSGIPNHAAALIAEAIGKTKAEQLYYAVLTTRLRSTSDFHEAREQTEQECDERFGTGSTECTAVTKAFDTVEM